jgi:hypothetical protein
MTAVVAVAALPAETPPEYCDVADDAFRNKWCPCQVFDADGVVPTGNVQRCNLRTGWVEYVWIDEANVIRHSSEFLKAPLTLRAK